MKNSLLISSKYRLLGWVVFLCFSVLGYFCLTKEFKIPGFQLYNEKKEAMGISFADYNLTNEFAFLGITIGLLIISFAKEKIEDELINAVRLKSLQWAVLLSYVVSIILNFSVFGISFLIFMIYNVWTTLILFIIVFNINLYRLKKEA